MKRSSAWILVAAVALLALGPQPNQANDEANANEAEPAPEPYSFSYQAESTGGFSSRQETQDASGRIEGYYIIMGDDQRERRVDYVADKDGYRATISTNEVGTRSHSSADAQYNAKPPSKEQLDQANTTVEEYKYLEEQHETARLRHLSALESNNNQVQQQQQSAGSSIQSWSSSGVGRQQSNQQQQFGSSLSTSSSGLQQQQRPQFEQTSSFSGAQATNQADDDNWRSAKLKLSSNRQRARSTSGLGASTSVQSSGTIGSSTLLSTQQATAAEEQQQQQQPQGQEYTGAQINQQQSNIIDEVNGEQVDVGGQQETGAVGGEYTKQEEQLVNKQQLTEMINRAEPIGTSQLVIPMQQQRQQQQKSAQRFELASTTRPAAPSGFLAIDLGRQEVDARPELPAANFKAAASIGQQQTEVEQAAEIQRGQDDGQTTTSTSTTTTAEVSQQPQLANSIQQLIQTGGAKRQQVSSMSWQTSPRPTATSLADNNSLRPSFGSTQKTFGMQQFSAQTTGTTDAPVAGREFTSSVSLSTQQAGQPQQQLAAMQQPGVQTQQQWTNNRATKGGVQTQGAKRVALGPRLTPAAPTTTTTAATTSTSVAPRDEYTITTNAASNQQQELTSTQQVPSQVTESQQSLSASRQQAVGGGVKGRSGKANNNRRQFWQQQPAGLAAGASLTATRVGAGIQERRSKKSVPAVPTGATLAGAQNFRASVDHAPSRQYYGSRIQASS